MTKRKRTVKGITLPAKPKRTTYGGKSPSVCLDCGKPIDLGEVSLAITHKRIYTHSCGRVLFDPKYGTMEPML